MIDAADLVRRFYNALNRHDLPALISSYDESCVTEHVFPFDEKVYRGREQNRRRFEEYLSSYEGVLEGGAHVRVRTIAGIETGWGWVRVEWVAGERRRETGDLVYRTGHSHFLVEDGLIRRHRSVTRTVASAAPDEPAQEASLPRTYPDRPIVGVGAVVLVDGGVVLVKRQFEPLARQWSLPGGALELGETLEAGVAREVFEETGLRIEVGAVVEVFDRILLDEHQRIRYHFVLIDYLCRGIGGRLRHGSDVADVVLADPSDLARYELTAKASGVIAKAVRLAPGVGYLPAPGDPRPVG